MANELPQLRQVTSLGREFDELDAVPAVGAFEAMRPGQRGGGNCRRSHDLRQNVGDCRPAHVLSERGYPRGRPETTAR